MKNELVWYCGRGDGLENRAELFFFLAVPDPDPRHLARKENTNTMARL